MNLLKLSFIFFISAFANAAFAQSGSISGQVLDDTNNQLPYTYLYLKGTNYHAISDDQGNFKIINISAGSYSIICSSFQMDTIVRRLTVKPGEDTFIKLELKQSIQEVPVVIITATRTPKELIDVPMPVKVITDEQIKQMGSVRLNEVLGEQTGLAIVSDHGTGIQMQGLSSEYTLILINGEPVIGRTAGTFDLTRLAVGNIKRIEIVKGPSSSLYGSEALAGVINIITEKPKDSSTFNFKSRYGSYNTLNLSSDANFNIGKLAVNLFADHYSTSGYYLSSSEDKTVPPYQNYTFNSNLTYKFNENTKLSINGRLFTQNQNSTFSVVDKNNSFRISDVGRQLDWNFNPSFTHFLNKKDKLVARLYSTSFQTNSLMSMMRDGSEYDKSFFNQAFNRGELQYDREWNPKHHTLVGAGDIIESVNSTRYTSKKYFNNFYLFAQHDFSLLKNLEIISGFRLDKHSVYGTQINPKLSAKFKLKKWISFRASAGRGFKAPDFRQLYLNFSNPIEGYSVFGSEEIGFQFLQLQQQGQISQILIDPFIFKALKAEYSLATNFGWIAEPVKSMIWQVNIFRNDINDMIATSPVAIKSNGQSVYGYFNLAKVYTQGIETDISYKFYKNFSISTGYQYLIAKDKQVVSDIKKGLYFSKDPNTWITSRLSEKDYGGLFNRSRHMANVRLFYMNDKKGWSGSIRGIFCGRYGISDLNGNLILDSKNEYVKGYWLWNISISKKIFNGVLLQAGVDNVFNYKNPLYIPSVPGRIFYGSLSVPISKETFKTKKITLVCVNYL